MERMQATAHRIRYLNHFQLLRVRAAEGKEGLKKAYLEAARTYHPDRYAGRPERLVDLASMILEQYQEAYETLAKEKRRKKYLLSLSKDEFESSGASEVDIHDPVRASIYWKEGQRFLNAGKWAEAETNLRDSLRFDSSKPEVHAALGWVMYKAEPKRNRDTAAEMIRRAVDMDNNCDRAHYYLGMLSKEGGNDTKAELFFSRAVAANSGNIEAARELRLLQKRAGGGGKGKKGGLFSRFLSKDPDD